MEQCLGEFQERGNMHPEDLFNPGTYIDTVTGDVWEKYFDGKWRVNGMIHKPFPHSLVPESDPLVESHNEFKDNPQGRTLRDVEGYCE